MAAWAYKSTFAALSENFFANLRSTMQANKLH